jgi:predicted amidohydrolase YtcJ
MNRSTKSLIFVIGLALFVAVRAAYSECHKTILYNGKITTMDSRDSTAASITIEGDRITGLGMAVGLPRHDGCAQLIDLKGRRVVPGLIDSHNHIVVVSLRPGHDVRMDTASSIHREAG